MWYSRWIGIVNDAVACLDLDNKSWRFLPTAGGYYDQDPFLMQSWEYVREAIMKALKDAEFMEACKKHHA